MQDINRCLLVVKPKQPFLDWIHSCDDDRYTLEGVRDDSTAYLVPEYDLISYQPMILQDYYDFIFGTELLSWFTDEETWPKQRDLTMFLEWFDVEFHSLIFDLDNTPLEHFDYSSELDLNRGSNGH